MEERREPLVLPTFLICRVMEDDEVCGVVVARSGGVGGRREEWVAGNRGGMLCVFVG